MTLQVVNIRRFNTYCIQPNKPTVRWKNNWAMKKYQGICSHKCKIKCVSVDNKVAV